MGSNQSNLHVRGSTAPPSSETESYRSITSWQRGHWVSPMQRIPPEILSEIFIYCVLIDNEQFVRPRFRTAPLLLLRICRYWRDRAMSTPQLWCSLQIHDVKFTNRRRRLDDAKLLDLQSARLSSEMAMLGDWLSRARGQQLSLRIHFSGTLPDQAPECYEVLRYWFSGCHVLSLSVSREWLEVLSGLGCSVLEDFTIEVPHPPRTFGNVFSLQFPCHAPSLRRLTLKNTADMVVPYLAISPTSLKEMHCHDVLLSTNLVEFLKGCESLISWSMLSLHLPRNMEDSIGDMTLPNLEELVISDYSKRGEACSFLQNPDLHLPNLRRLDLNPKASGIANVASITAFATRSGCTLTHLKMHSSIPVCSEVAEFRALLSAIPSLEVLHIQTREVPICSEDGSSISIFASLMRPPAEAGLIHRLPCLSDLAITTTCIPPGVPSATYIENMIRSRTQDHDYVGHNVARLTSVMITLAVSSAVPMTVRWHRLVAGRLSRELTVEHFNTYCVEEVTL
ncbi:hypothetical protein OE88DRAFT_1662427 [Heliocybe sulcata]|uniref:Uncharacterized protein n=1 Tax=Heliocybe sulcata TaxID=5364 RepID=A0A5C3MXX3_9AGAM|nr:hypothetical protein OE88DRAFT_1662427 [Heliocybe sulcata]